MSHDNSNLAKIIHHKWAQHRDEPPTKKVDLNIDRILSIPLAPNQSLYIFDLQTREVIHQSNFTEQTGYKPSELNFVLIGDMIFPQDRPMSLSLSLRTAEYSMTHDSIPFQTSFSCNHRIIRANGDVARMLKQTMIAGTNEQGRATHGYTISTDITNMGYEGPVTYELFMNDEQMIRRQILETHLALLQVPFTPREVEILELLAKGYTSAEIGRKLQLTKNTVDTYRRIMLKKASANNVANLVSLGKEYGIV